MIEKLDDVVIPFTLNENSFRGKIVKLSDSIGNALNKHSYPDLIGQIISEMLVAVSIIGNSYKETSIKIQLKSDGIVNLIIVDYFNNGKIRGYCSWDHEKYNEITDKAISFRQLVGNGVVAITFDQGDNTDLYQGIVEIQGKTLSDILNAYFAQSEQTETIFKIAAKISNVPGEIQTYDAGGLMIQKLPNIKLSQPELIDDWNRIKLFFNTVHNDELLSKDNEPGILLYRLFHQDNIRIFDAEEIKHDCKCSKERAFNILKQLNQVELEEFKENNEIEVVCQFCSNKEIFTDQDFYNSEL